MSVLPIGIGAEEGGYQIERSLRFNSADSAYLSRTPASAGNRRTWTWSGWVKRSTLGTGQYVLDAGTGPNTFLLLGAGNVLTFADYTSGPTYNLELITTQVLRDVSAWYHIVIAVDTTQATSTNRVKIYLNGSQITAFSTATYPSQNFDTGWNNATAHRIGSTVGGTNYLNGYLTEINFIDGSALDPTSFGEYNTDTGVWQPKAYTGSYGTNGFYLDFADNSSTTALGYDAAGSNDWTPNNFSVTAGAGNDSVVDTPTPYGTDTGAGGEVRGNYCTWNPLRPSGATLSNGNLDAVTGNNGSSNSGYLTSTFWMPESGKYYFEVTPTSVGEVAIGLTTNSNNRAAIYYRQGDVYINGSISFTGSSYTNNDVIGVAVDMDALTIRFYKNNTAQGSGTSSLSGMTGPFVSCVAHLSGTGSSTVTANFGQRPFAYAAPSGFKALCTQNLPEPTVVDGGEYFNAVTYTGTGSAQSITGVGFQPDLVWLKARSNAYTHVLVDSIRGTDKVLVSASTGAENTTNSGEDFTAFNSDGFSVGTPVNFNSTNANGATIVGWNWKANGSGVSNTDGTITSTVSANTTAGFSIVTYTGNGTLQQTVGHGLGTAPKMIILKNRSGSDASLDNWWVYHTGTAIPPNRGLKLNGTDAQIGSTVFWWNDPTSTVFGLANTTDARYTNASGANYVAYCFAPVEGYSAFGSFVGNGSSADGPYVHLGFRARWIMFKKTSGTSNWSILDTARDGYNVADNPLLPNSSAAESTSTSTSGAIADILSNGFKVRGNSGDINDSGATYIYAAFAEVPMKFALGR